MSTLKENLAIAALFEDLQPDADLGTKMALGNSPETLGGLLWSYKLDGHWYTCRAWDEVLEVAESLGWEGGAR